VCQFHALRDASKQAYEQDRKVKTAMRKHLLPKVKAVRKQLRGLMRDAEPAEMEQLSVLDGYAAAILTALHRDGTAPLDFAAVQIAQDLDAVDASLQRLAKKGGL
jgi:hypothetical protein